MAEKIKIELILNYLEKKKMGKIEFAKACRISPTTLNNILANNENYRYLTLIKIAKAMNIKYTDFLYSDKIWN